MLEVQLYPDPHSMRLFWLQISIQQSLNGFQWSLNGFEMVFNKVWMVFKHILDRNTIIAFADMDANQA